MQAQRNTRFACPCEYISQSPVAAAICNAPTGPSKTRIATDCLHCGPAKRRTTSSAHVVKIANTGKATSVSAFRIFVYQVFKRSGLSRNLLSVAMTTLPTGTESSCDGSEECLYASEYGPSSALP